MSKQEAMWIIGLVCGMAIGMWVQHLGTYFSWPTILWSVSTSVVLAIVDSTVADGSKLHLRWPWQWKKP